MIRNDKEYAVAKAELERFSSVLDEFDVVAEIGAGVDPVIAKAQRDSFARKVGELSDDIQRYELLKEGSPSDIGVAHIDRIGHALVEARISQGLTQKALAARAGLKEQQ